MPKALIGDLETTLGFKWQGTVLRFRTPSGAGPLKELFEEVNQVVEQYSSLRSRTAIRKSINLKAAMDVIFRDFGKQIWPDHRPEWLLSAKDANDPKGLYPQDLRFSQAVDRAKIREKFYEWIVSKTVRRHERCKRSRSERRSPSVEQPATASTSRPRARQPRAKSFHDGEVSFETDLSSVCSGDDPASDFEDNVIAKSVTRERATLPDQVTTAKRRFDCDPDDARDVSVNTQQPTPPFSRLTPENASIDSAARLSLFAEMFREDVTEPSDPTQQEQPSETPNPVSRPTQSTSGSSHRQINNLDVTRVYFPETLRAPELPSMIITSQASADATAATREVANPEQQSPNPLTGLNAAQRPSPPAATKGDKHNEPSSVAHSHRNGTMSLTTPRIAVPDMEYARTEAREKSDNGLCVLQTRSNQIPPPSRKRKQDPIPCGNAGEITPASKVRVLETQSETLESSSSVINRTGSIVARVREHAGAVSRPHEIASAAASRVSTYETEPQATATTQPSSMQRSQAQAEPLNDKQPQYRTNPILVDPPVQSTELPAAAVVAPSDKQLPAPAQRGSAQEQLDSATTGEAFERVQIELCWGSEAEVPDYLIMEDCTTVDEFFKLIDDQVPPELVARGKVADEIRVKTVFCASNLKFDCRIPRTKAGRGSIRQLVKKMKMLQEGEEAELRFDVVFA